eukprot:2516557-Amphidinium_carterae.1
MPLHFVSLGSQQNKQHFINEVLAENNMSTAMNAQCFHALKIAVITSLLNVVPAAKMNPGIRI